MKRAAILSWLVYVATGLAVVALAYFAATSSASDTIVERASNWAALAVITTVIFGYAARFFPYLWRTRRFWTILVLALAIHLCAWTCVFLRVAHVPKIDFALAGLAEFVLLNWIVIRWGAPARKPGWRLKSEV